MKLTTGILLLAMSTGTALAQSPNIVQNTKGKLNAAQQQRVAEENAALGAAQGSPAKPAPAGKPASAVKPVVKVAVQPADHAGKPAVQVKPVTAKATPKAASTPVKAAASVNAKPVVKKPAATKISVAPVAPQPKQGAQKTATAKKQSKKSTTKQASTGAPKKDEAKADKPVSTDSATAEPPRERKTITAEGRRDPFISPVVSRASGPACSIGKRCLAIDQISVRGVVKSENGMIAVVVNSLNKAYFLKENDPVYNGYVVRITGDSVIFKETVQDRLGKESTREVVKKITTPAV
jgi:Tfp pilus assembly protein PilP